MHDYNPSRSKKPPRLPEWMPTIRGFEWLMRDAIRVLGIKAVDSFLANYDWPIPPADQPRCLIGLALLMLEQRLDTCAPPGRVQ
jgi:hypothetical protein